MPGRYAKDLEFIRLMLVEERRLQAQMIGRVQFMFFPIMILFMAFVIGLSAKQLLSEIPMSQMYLVLHSIIFIYGLGVGGFALFGDRIAERRFGSISMLLETPTIQPIDFRSMFFAFYVKDTVYYLLYTIVPLVGGIGLTVPFTGFRVTSILFLFLTVTLSFLLGLSYSFLLSSVYVRWKKTFAVAVLALFAALVGSYFAGGGIAPQLIPSIALQNTRDAVYLLISMVLILAFSAVAIWTIKISFGRATERYAEMILPTSEKFSFAKQYSTFMAKDWIDLTRSRSLSYIIVAYVGPLAFLAILFWFIGSVIEISIHFNTIFFAAMMGFFGVEIYAWLNMLDTPTLYEVLPVEVTQLVKAKLLMFLMFAGVISTAFLIVLSLLQSEASMLAISLVVAYCTASYTVTATAYLTGLRTNSYLFDPRILGKFAAFVIPPLVALSILSFSYSDSQLVSSLTILLICALLAVATYFLYGRMEKRWNRETFAL